MVLLKDTVGDLLPEFVPSVQGIQQQWHLLLRLDFLP